MDLLVLFTEEARRQAGGNPNDCHDTNGVMAYIHQRINDINTAFSRSQIPAQIGVATVTKLYGYTLIPHNGDNQNTYDNLANITKSLNIKAYRNVVGADVVSAAVRHANQSRPVRCRERAAARLHLSQCNSRAATSARNFRNGQLTSIRFNAAIVDVPTHELGHVLGAEHHRTGGGIPPSDRVVSVFVRLRLWFGRAGWLRDDHVAAVRSQHFPVRLLQFSNPSVLYMGRPTGIADTADNAHTLRNLLPGTAAFRIRPEQIFASGFDVNNPCPGITY